MGGVIISIRPEAKYFDFSLSESVQGWRRKWFYVKDEKTGTQKFGLPPFDSKTPATKLKSWEQSPSESELAETDPLVKRIYALQSTKGKELSGLQIMTHFLRLRVQPLQSRSLPLWSFTGPEDSARIVKDNWSLEELNKLARRLTSLTATDPIPTDCRVDPYNSKNPLPPVSFFLFALSDKCFD